MKPSANAYRRCRPLLGTFVEISLSGDSAEQLRLCGEKGFLAIESVARQMSFHEPLSEVSRVNRTPIGQWTKVSVPLLHVLSFALDLQFKSEGRFNVSTARPLVFWGMLPGKKIKIDWKVLEHPGFEIQGHQVRRLLPVQIDLGGIAKGFAVDCAVQAMGTREIMGYVNAGGDVRVFGQEPQPVWIRSGDNRESQLRQVFLKNESMATSTVFPGKSVYVDIVLKKSIEVSKTVHIRAEHCMVADALTKVGVLLPFKVATRIASEYGAKVSVVA